MIKNFLQFNESVNTPIEEKIEDYFMDFMDDYRLDFSIQQGVILNDSWIPESMIKDTIKICNDNNIKYIIKKGYQITFGKKDTIRHIELEDMSDQNIDQLNIDLNNSINRMISSMDGYKPLHIPKIGIKAWSIIFYIIEK